MKYASVQVNTRRGRRSAAPAAAFALLAAAALCVMLPLANARVTALRAECEELAGRIAELEDANARLSIEYEGLYSLEEVEDYARNVLGMAARS